MAKDYVKDWASRAVKEAAANRPKDEPPLVALTPNVNSSAEPTQSSEDEFSHLCQSERLRRDALEVEHQFLTIVDRKLERGERITEAERKIYNDAIIATRGKATPHDIENVKLRREICALKKQLERMPTQPQEIAVLDVVHAWKLDYSLGNCVKHLQQHDKGLAYLVEARRCLDEAISHAQGKAP